MDYADLIRAERKLAREELIELRAVGIGGIGAAVLLFASYFLVKSPKDTLDGQISQKEFLEHIKVNKGLHITLTEAQVSKIKDDVQANPERYSRLWKEINAPILTR